MTEFDFWLVSPDQPHLPVVVAGRGSFFTSGTRLFNQSLSWSLLPLLRECDPQTIVIPYSDFMLDKCIPKDFFSLSFKGIVDEEVTWLFVWGLLIVVYCSGMLYGIWKQYHLLGQLAVNFIWFSAALPIAIQLGFTSFFLCCVIGSIIAFLLYLLYHLLVFAHSGRHFARFPKNFNTQNISSFIIFFSNVLIVLCFFLVF
jgi:hypothetical protein